MIFACWQRFLLIGIGLMSKLNLREKGLPKVSKLNLRVKGLPKMTKLGRLFS